MGIRCRATAVDRIVYAGQFASIVVSLHLVPARLSQKAFKEGNYDCSDDVNNSTVGRVKRSGW